MALGTVVFQQGLFGYDASSKDLSGALVGASWGCGGDGEFVQILGTQTGNSNPYGNWNGDSSNSGPYVTDLNLNRVDSYSPERTNCFGPAGGVFAEKAGESAAAALRSKKRRMKCRKNKQDMESQRMTHIEVERNRRKQMNQYLSALRLIMPNSYVQRGDQASVIGGAINFVKELEHRLQFLGIHKEGNSKEWESESGSSAATAVLPLEEFFTFPQYTMATADGGMAESVADVEVTIVESHASIKVRTRKQPKQLLMLVSELQTLRLTVLHLNVTTMDQFVLYTISVKVDDDCRMSSADDIAAAVYQLLGRIQEEAMVLK